jgi:hypothetical protein
MGWVMKRVSLLLALLLSSTLGGSSFADVTVEPWSPPDSDQGNIASDGSGGRQIQIRPMTSQDIGQQWAFFPAHELYPEIFPDPTPATPAQSDIYLTAGTPLILALPQLPHFPWGANVSLSHSIVGQQITVDATIEYLAYSADTIYGRHEYLEPLGSLSAGTYRLNLNLVQSAEVRTPGTWRTTGYVDFVVHAVPEPSPFFLGCSCGLVLLPVVLRNRR